mmetsp:Transcript_18820/g.43359  ORF Transcript_18820/g.43359 Transcript_18820/m.43359 type:complete len:302 (+) Transcript_18820:154-1059(+)
MQHSLSIAGGFGTSNPSIPRAASQLDAVRGDVVSILPSVHHIDEFHQRSPKHFLQLVLGAMQCSPLPLVLCRSTSLSSTSLHCTALLSGHKGAKGIPHGTGCYRRCHRQRYGCGYRYRYRCRRGVLLLARRGKQGRRCSHRGLSYVGRLKAAKRHRCLRRGSIAFAVAVGGRSIVSRCLPRGFGSIGIAIGIDRLGGHGHGLVGGRIRWCRHRHRRRHRSRGGGSVRGKRRRLRRHSARLHKAIERARCRGRGRGREGGPALLQEELARAGLNGGGVLVATVQRRKGRAKGRIVLRRVIVG